MNPIEAAIKKIIPLIDTAAMEAEMAELTEIEKWTDFDSFEKAVDWLVPRYEAAGCTNIPTRFPADGKAQWGTYTAPMGFRVSGGTCRIVEPTEKAQLLGDRADEPNTVIVGSGHTGPAGITAPVVQISQGSDFDAVDVKGKIVFSNTMHPQWIRNRTIAEGGVAIVSAYAEKPDKNHAAVKWVNTWDSENDGWLPTKQAAEENLPGISLSPDTGKEIEALLGKGELIMNVTVEGEYFEGEMVSLNTLMQGETDVSVFLTGHLFEQGIIDNASGAIISLTVARVLNQLKTAAGMDAFTRSVRHFHGQECYSVLALKTYNPEQIKPGFAHIDLDSIADADRNLCTKPGLMATYNFSNLLFNLVCRAMEQETGRTVADAGGFEPNCTLLADPQAGGLATCMFCHGGTDAWHTSNDRPGVQAVDQKHFLFAAAAAAAWAYILVSGGVEEARFLLDHYKQKVTAVLKNGDTDDTDLYLEQQITEIQSLRLLANEDQKDILEQEINACIQELQQIESAKKEIIPEGSAEETAVSRRLFPKSLIAGPAVARYFEPAELKVIGGPKWDGLQMVLKAWADGSRSIYDITRLALLETGKYDRLTLSYTLALFRIYAKAGLVELEEKEMAG